MASPTTLEVIGGQGGGPFSLTGEKNGVSLEKIWVWVEVSLIKAVRAWLSDGTNKTFGIPSGTPQEYVFSPGECFTSLSLWDNGLATRLGAIKFKTNKGGNFSAQMTSVPLKTEYPIDVGSGYCLGIAGRCGYDIDNMGFMFLNKVESAVLTNVSYPPLTQLIPKVAKEELKSVTHENKTSAKQEQKIETSERVIIKSSWSMSRSLTATFSMDVKAGIPEIVKGPSGNSVRVGKESTYSLEQADERKETLITTVEVPPRRKVDVNITLGKITFDLPYTGTVKITCKNGGVLEYGTKGQYKGVFYTDVKVKTAESDL